MDIITGLNLRIQQYKNSQKGESPQPELVYSENHNLSNINEESYLDSVKSNSYTHDLDNLGDQHASDRLNLDPFRDTLEKYPSEVKKSKADFKKKKANRTNRTQVVPTLKSAWM